VISENLTKMLNNIIKNWKLKIELGPAVGDYN
jgi:hypothetical protein